MKQNVQVVRTRTKAGFLDGRHVQVAIGFWPDMGKDAPPRVRTKTWCRWHLLYTVGGKGILTWPGGQLALLPRMAVLLWPHTEYSYVADPELRWSQYSAEFLPRPHWYEWLHWPKLVPGIMTFNIKNQSDHQQIRQAFHNAIAIAETPRPFWEDFALVALEKILLLFCRLRPSPTDSALPPSQKSQPTDRQLQAAVEFMEKNQAKPIEWQQIAHAAGISCSYLAALFQKHLRMTPLQYLTMLRINTAQRMLRTTNKQISQIAHGVGYRDPAAFCSRFRKITGRTPGEYRKALK